MMRAIVQAAVLTASPEIAADAAKPSAASPDATPGGLDLTLPDLDVLRPRSGWHAGFGGGLGFGSEITGLDVVSGPQAIVHVDANYGYLRLETRVSFLGYQLVGGGRTATGFGLAFLQGIHWNSRFMLSGGYGLVVQHESSAERVGHIAAYRALVLSPAIRLGAKRNSELGVQIVVLQDGQLQAKGGAMYLSLSYLML